MLELIVKNLADNVGPGDIVGAFTNEAQIQGDQIGNIDFLANNAIVEVDNKVADKVIKIMDNNKISGYKVNVERDNNFRDKFNRSEKYIKKYKKLVQLEREEEMKRHQLEISKLSGGEREQRGRAILNLRGRDEGKAFGDKFLIKFMRQKQGEKLPDNEFSIGDLLMLSQNQPLANNNPTGTVVEKTNYSITVAFDNKLDNFAYGKGLRLDLYVNDITFQRMLSALEILQNEEASLKGLKDRLLGLAQVELSSEKEIEFSQQNLNSSQKKSVKKAMASKYFFLIHGPPGTGKTKTLIEVIVQAVKRNSKTLATAASNTAVDNMVERLVKQGLEVVRVGHPVRVAPILREQTLDYIIEDNNKYKKSQQLRDKAYDLIDQQEKYTHPSGRWRRGMSNDEIKKLAQQDRGSRGVPADKIEEMANWLKLQTKIDSLFKQINKLEDEAVADIFNKADVICTTNSTAGADILKGEEFELLVIDEATQASEPSTLIPLVKAKKAVMAGDHKQLPPTILNKEASNKGLSKSLFERLIELYGPKIKDFLKVQYRMNSAIMNFSNNQFYNGKLIADDSVCNWQLEDLGIDLVKGSAPTEKVINQKEAICFLDTQGMKAPEKRRKRSNSLSNRIEAELVTEITGNTIKSGLENNDIAIISPYKAQVKLISNLLKNEQIEVDTVDGFQGREKEVVILSLVRSNQNKNIGFLRDIRRLNVALTRAKKKLIILADSGTISSHETYKGLIDYCKKKGYYYAL